MKEKFYFTLSILALCATSGLDAAPPVPIATASPRLPLDTTPAISIRNLVHNKIIQDFPTHKIAIHHVSCTSEVADDMTHLEIHNNGKIEGFIPHNTPGVHQHSCHIYAHPNKSPNYTVVAKNDPDALRNLQASKLPKGTSLPSSGGGSTGGGSGSGSGGTGGSGSGGSGSGSSGDALVDAIENALGHPVTDIPFTIE